MSARITEAMVEAGAALILDILNTAALAFPTDPAAKHLAMRLSRACLAAALSTEPGETEGWQPIETAPKDGSRLLTWQPDAASLKPSILIHHWDGSKWVEDDGSWFVFSPTRWHPLPAAPLPEDTHHGR